MNGFSRRFSRIKGKFSEARRMPRLGIIRLGLKRLSTTGKEYPQDVDYFVLKDAPGVAEVYGEKPRELDVMLPVDDPEIVFPQSLAWYGKGKGLKCHGDGVEAERYDEEKKEWFGMKCPCPMLKTDDNPKGECTENATLMVILPKVNMGGIFQITTKSYNSVVDINSGLDLTRLLVKRIALVPLKLRRVERTTHHDDPKKGRVSGKHFTLTLGLDATAEATEVIRSQTERIIADARRISIELPAPVMENPEDTPVDTEDAEPEVQVPRDVKPGEILPRPTKPDAEPQPGLPGIAPLSAASGGAGSTPAEPEDAPANIGGRPADKPAVEVAAALEISIHVQCLKQTAAGADVLRKILKNYGLANSRVIPDNEETLTFYLEELRKAVDNLEPEKAPVSVDDL